MMPACAVRMGTYEAIKSALLLRAPGVVPPGALIALASSLSVVASCTVRVPLDMVKVQVQTGAATSVRAALRSAWAANGVRGLYRGTRLALMRDVPFFSLNLLAYEQMKAAALSRARARALADGRPLPTELSPGDVLLIGAAAQGIAGFCTNPLDALKTRVQSVPGGSGVRAALQAALRDGGPAALMGGAWMRVVWIAPQGCVYYPVYEQVQGALRSGEGEKAS